eukprot:tig00000158_g10126.t1
MYPGFRNYPLPPITLLGIALWCRSRFARRRGSCARVEYPHAYGAVAAAGLRQLPPRVPPLLHHRIINSIQTFGVLFVLETGAAAQDAKQQAALIIRQLSANASELLGPVVAEEALGKDLADFSTVFSSEVLDAIRGRVCGTAGGPFRAICGTGEWVGALHPSGTATTDKRHFLLEMLQHKTEIDPLGVLSDAQLAVQRLQCATSADELGNVMVEEISRLTGFARVMLYRFDSDGHGQVIAECLSQENQESYLHLMYPATDVPFVARSLYCKTKFRLIPDIDYTPVPIVSSPGSARLDTSLAMLRGVSPCHIRYLRNMGVRASLSFAIVQDGKCWGLCCCHHYEPRALPYHVMTACTALVSMFQVSMQAKAHEQRQEYEMKARTIQAQILNQSCENLDYVDALINCSPCILDLVRSTGASIVAGGTVCSLGTVPTKEQCLDFALWLRDETAGMSADEIYTSTCLMKDYPAASEFKHVASGVLAVAISREQSEFVFWWRGEVSNSVHWAGMPDKSYVVSQDGLHPRISFQRWTALVTDRCEAWSEADIAAARIFRITVGDLHVRISAELKLRGEMLGKLNAELEEANSKLRYVASELTTLIQTVPVPVFGVDKGVKIDEWNPACEKHFGFAEAEVFGGDFSERVVIYEQREAVTRALRQALAGQQVKDFELTVRASPTGNLATPSIVFANGKRTEYSLHAAPRMDSNGNTVGAVAVCQDITERKEVAKAEVRAAQARSANDAKSMFLATVSHEMRTPLNGILGMLQLAMDSESLPKVAEDYVKRAFQSGEHLLALISDILDISQIESGKMQLRHMAFDIRSLLRSAINLIGPKAEAKGLKVSSCLSDDFPVRVIGDSDRLRQVLINLCSNAVKYTRKGRITVTCSIEEEEEDRSCGKKTARLRFEIKDTGIGIRESDLKILFTLFTRIREENFQDPGGTGLGLAICKQLVQLMNGEIGVQSNYGKGSVFWFVIPFEISSEPAPLQDEDVDEFKPSIEVHRSAVILLAEDNEFNMEVARVLLQNAGHVVFTARNGLEAVDLFARRVRLAKSGTSTQAAFDLVLMDCEMPVMSGYEAVRNIRTVESSECVARTPVIALTAHAMKEHSEKCFSSGMDDYMTKPISKEVLLQTVAKHMQPRRFRPGAPLPGSHAGSLPFSRPGSASMSSTNSPALSSPAIVPSPGPMGSPPAPATIQTSCGFASLASGLPGPGSAPGSARDRPPPEPRLGAVDGSGSAPGSGRQSPRGGIANFMTPPSTTGGALEARMQRHPSNTDLTLPPASLSRNTASPTNLTRARLSVGGTSAAALAAQVLASSAAAAAAGVILSSNGPEEGSDPGSSGAAQSFRRRTSIAGIELPLPANEPAACDESDDSVVDFKEAIRALGGSEELFRSLLGKFSHSSLETVNSIELALISRQWSEVRRLAHSLKGSASYVGAHLLAASSLQLQHAVDADSLETVRPLAKVVRLEYERVRHWITSYLAPRS